MVSKHRMFLARIGDAFVGHKLLLNIRDNQRVKIIALRQDDGRWAAISLAPI
ncbi:MAG: hypothetical protein J1E63_10710 [Muribaculaceae bacterium]|nr:hypothetical protein [Muribaculaceae bacterium]